MLSQEIRNEIEELAYFKWCEAGKPDGNDLFFWIEAEKERLNMKTSFRRIETTKVEFQEPDCQADVKKPLEESETTTSLKKNEKSLTWMEKFRQYWKK